jgi:predicted RNA methylase
MREKILTEKDRVSAIFTQKAISLIKDKNILDLGSFQGDLSNHALVLGAKSITAIEKTKEDFDIGKKLFPDVNFININIEDSEILDYIEKAEVVFCLGIFYLLKDPKKIFFDISKNKKIKTIIVDSAYIEEDTFVPMEHHGKNLFFNMTSTDNLEKMFVDSGFNILNKQRYAMGIKNTYMQNRICFLLHRE